MAEFDEYDYLEKAVEKPEESNDANGEGGKVDDGHKSSKRRSNEEEQEYRTKRIRGDDEHRSRRDDRERDRDRDRDRERDRDRDRDRDRERDKGRERERERGEKDKSRDRPRDRDRDGEKDRGRVKDRDAEKDKLREKERRQSREKRDRDREREKEKEPAAEPEADPERDQRTVFAYQINLKADERDVYEFFSRAGKVRDVRLIMDRNSRRSKGVGYIEFYDVMSVPMAIALSGQLLLGQPVMVKPSEAEKNLVQSTPLPMMAGMPGLGTPGLYIGPYSGGARRLYVGNLHFNMSETELRQVFEPFGPVELVQLPVDPETNQCKGFGFVQYARLEDARAAQQNLNGLELAGRPIKVTAVSEQMTLPDMGPPVNPGELDDDEGGGLSLNARSRAELMLKLDRSGTASSLAGSTAGTAPVAPAGLPAGGLGMLMPGLQGLQGLQGMLRPGMTGFPGLPGLSMLGLPGMGMSGAGLAGASPGAVGTVPGEVVGNPSECLLLKNMFDEESEKGPDFELDIKEDVQDECSKFGSVKHIFVDGKSAGHVYVKFDGVTSAQTAQRALHGRWFAGKTISATYMTPEAYKTKFPES